MQKGIWGVEDNFINYFDYHNLKLGATICTNMWCEGQCNWKVLNQKDDKVLNQIYYTRISLIQAQIN